jgi:hypothetical protein
MNDTELRPMTLGELLDRTFSLYRRNFLLFVGIMAIPAILAAVGGMVMQIFQEPMARFQTESTVEMSPEVLGMLALFILATLVFSLVYWILHAVALGATTSALIRVSLGQTVTVRVAYASMCRRLARLVLVSLAALIVVVGAVFLVILTIGLAGGVGGAISPFVGVPIVLLAIPAGGFLVLYLILGYAVCIPAFVVENTGVLDSLRRSMTLMRGHRLRGLLILLVMILLSFVANLILQGPMIVSTIAASLQGGIVPLSLRVLGVIGGGVAGALTGPLIMLSFTLLYLDIRVRKESFDLRKSAAEADAGALPASPQPPWAPPQPPSAPLTPGH